MQEHLSWQALTLRILRCWGTFDAGGSPPFETPAGQWYRQDVTFLDFEKPTFLGTCKDEDLPGQLNSKAYSWYIISKETESCICSCKTASCICYCSLKGVIGSRTVCSFVISVSNFYAKLCSFRFCCHELRTPSFEIGFYSFLRGKLLLLKRNVQGGCRRQ